MPTPTRPNLQQAELEYITSKLLMEFQERFRAWNEEYKDLERDLGMRGSFPDFWRKAKKVKAVVWEGVDDGNWREGIRTILFEVICNTFLMLFDLDHRNVGDKDCPYPEDHPGEPTTGNVEYKWCPRKTIHDAHYWDSDQYGHQAFWCNWDTRPVSGSDRHVQPG